MNRRMRMNALVGIFLPSAYLGVSLAYPDLIPAQWRAWLARGIGAGIALVLVAVLISQGRTLVLRRRRGVVRESPVNKRDSAFEEVHARANDTVAVYGVLMTRVSMELEVFYADARRGLDIYVEMIDPDWLESQPQVLALVKSYYRMNDVLTGARESLARLAEAQRRINGERESGRRSGRMEIRLVKQWTPSSATIADPGSSDAWGVVEHHLPAMSTRRADRAVLTDYPPPWWRHAGDDDESKLRVYLRSRTVLPTRAYVDAAPDAGAPGEASPPGPTNPDDTGDSGGPAAA